MLGARRLVTSILLAGAGAAAAIACSAASRSARRTLPYAGGADDDGTGFLARWSRGQHALAWDCADYGACDGAESYGGLYGVAYGGVGYGWGYDQYGGRGYGYAPYVPPPAPTESYTGSTVVNGGAIVGTVTWRGAPRVPAQLPNPPGAGCEEQPNPTLRASATGGIADTVVDLADIGVGKQPAAVGGILQARRCTFLPHVQIAAPIGASLLLANDDGRARSIRVHALGKKPVLLDELIPTHGEMRLPLMTSGIFEVDGEAGALGWVVVPKHPYYAITDENGHFRMDDVPPGSYSIVAWHEPIVVGTEDGTGRPIRSNPVEIRGHVKVLAGGTLIHDIDLK